MKRLIFFLVFFGSISVARAWYVPQNPDQYPSIGLNYSQTSLTGDLNGLQNIQGGNLIHDRGNDLALDIRFPVRDSFTISVFGDLLSSEFRNDLVSQGTSERGYRVGAGVRYYVTDK